MGDGRQPRVSHRAHAGRDARIQNSLGNVQAWDNHVWTGCTNDRRRRSLLVATPETAARDSVRTMRQRAQAGHEVSVSALASPVHQPAVIRLRVMATAPNPIGGGADGTGFAKASWCARAGGDIGRNRPFRGAGRRTARHTRSAVRTMRRAHLLREAGSHRAEVAARAASGADPWRCDGSSEQVGLTGGNPGDAEGRETGSGLTIREEEPGGPKDGPRGSDGGPPPKPELRLQRRTRTVGSLLLDLRVRELAAAL
jgi:hypothetical protein